MASGRLDARGQGLSVNLGYVESQIRALKFNSLPDQSLASGRLGARRQNKGEQGLNINLGSVEYPSAFVLQKTTEFDQVLAEFVTEHASLSNERL